jgi:hypothetical protein
MPIAGQSEPVRNRSVPKISPSTKSPAIPGHTCASASGAKRFDVRAQPADPSRRHDLAAAAEPVHDRVERSRHDEAGARAHVARQATQKDAAKERLLADADQHRTDESERRLPHGLERIETEIRQHAATEPRRDEAEADPRCADRETDAQAATPARHAEPHCAGPPRSSGRHASASATTSRTSKTRL